MPQIFQVLRCYKCFAFQVHQKKKSNKFQCKICGENQSIKRHYGLGTGQECRQHVQKLNVLRGDIEEVKNDYCCEEGFEDSHVDKEVFTENKIKKTNSKWSAFIEGGQIEKSQTLNITETMYLNDEEVVFEKPKKFRKVNSDKGLLNNRTPSISSINRVNKKDELDYNLKSVVDGGHNFNKDIKPINNCFTISSNNYQTIDIHNNDENIETYKNEFSLKNNNNNSNKKRNEISKWAQYSEDLCSQHIEEDNINKVERFLSNVDSQFKSEESLKTNKINLRNFFCCEDIDLDSILEL